MKDRKKTIATLKDILKGVEPITALFDDLKPKNIIKVYMKRDGKFFVNSNEITEEEYNQTMSKPGVIHINVKRDAPPIENQLPGPAGAIFVNQSNK